MERRSLCYRLQQTFANILIEYHHDESEVSHSGILNYSPINCDAQYQWWNKQEDKRNWSKESAKILIAMVEITLASLSLCSINRKF